MHTFHSPVSGSGFYENRFLYRNNAERVEAFKGTLEKQGINLRDPHVQDVLDNYKNLMRHIANNPLRKNPEPRPYPELPALSLGSTVPMATHEQSSLPLGVAQQAIRLLLTEVLPSLSNGSALKGNK